MSKRIPKGGGAQVVDMYVEVQALFKNAVRDGYDRHAVAEALMHGAREVLADDTEFWTVFDRFKTLRFP